MQLELVLSRVVVKEPVEIALTAGEITPIIIGRERTDLNVHASSLAVPESVGEDFL